MENDLLLCECHSPEHQMIASYNYEENTVYLLVKLNAYGFFRRLNKGLKYIFGYKSRYGEWDEFILNPNDAPKIRRILDVIENNPKTI